MQVWNVLPVARWKCRTQKVAIKSLYGYHRTTLSGYIFATKVHIDNRKNLLNSNVFLTCAHDMMNFGLLAAEICWRVWGIRANFNWFCVLAALLYSTLVVGVSQTLRRWKQGVTLYTSGRPSRWALAHISSSIFFSWPDLNRRRLDVYNTSTHGVALVRII